MHAYNKLRLQHTLQAACLTNSQLACMAWFHSTWLAPHVKPHHPGTAPLRRACLHACNPA